MAREKHLTANLSPLGAWAFSIGVSIGWGSLVVTSNTYLAQAGPLGSVLGMVTGALVMLLMSRNYAYMIERCPEAGGAYAYARDLFGYDFGFISAWFAALTYLAVFWANATALPLFARYFLGNVFRFGRMYALFGYDVYLGEALLTLAAILLTAALCIRYRGAALRAMIGMALLLCVGIIGCFIVGALRSGGGWQPAFVPGGSALSQVVNIAVISPWAFIGFECISHGAEEFNFKRSRAFRILTLSVLVVTALYICVTLLSVTAYPPRYESWLAYIRDLGNLEGIEALPAFYAAQTYMGGFGVAVLMVTLLALVLTSLIGNLTVLSRLFYALAQDRILPERFADVSRFGTPAKAMMLIVGVSAVIPFLGRTAIGWIVDVTSFGATLIYGIVSAAALKQARLDRRRAVMATGAAGALIMVGYGLYLLIPNLFSAGTMERESYFLFVIWSVLGFIYFRGILKRDRFRRFGKSIVVWIVLLSLILFVSLVWMSQSTIQATDAAMRSVQAYYASEGVTVETGIVSEQLDHIRQTNATSILTVLLLFGTSLGVLLNNYALMSRRAEESEQELGHVRSIVHTDALTGVKSKHSYIEKETETDALIDAGRAEPFAVVVCDVNGLKHVNDTLGHKAGDDYIRAASAMICELFQHSPVYRTGGDEFVVFLTGRDYAARDALMAELHDRSLSHIPTGDVVVSGGLAVFDPAADPRVHAVFERADHLMYQEKQFLKSKGAKTRE